MWLIRCYYIYYCKRNDRNKSYYIFNEKNLILLGLILEYNQVFILYCAVQEWGILYLVQKSLHDFRLISKKIRSISFCR